MGSGGQLWQHFFHPGCCLLLAPHNILNTGFYDELCSAVRHLSYLDDDILSRNGKSELRHMLYLDLKPGDLVLIRDARRASSGVFYLIHVSFLLPMAIQNPRLSFADSLPYILLTHTMWT